MATTIQVDETTKQMLESMKEERNISSYDKLIKELITKEKKIPKSMFGVDKGKGIKIEKVKFNELQVRAG